MASRSWNRVELIGNLTRDPELRYTPTGSAVATFTVATNRTYISEGERKEEADFHRAVAWNKLAELCSQLLKKGNRVFVSGRLQNRSWETQDGQTRQTTEIVIEDMIVLTSRNGTTSAPDLPVEEATTTASASKTLTPQKEDVSEPEDKPVKKKSKSEPQAGEEKEEVKDDDLPF